MRLARRKIPMKNFERSLESRQRDRHRVPRRDLRNPPLPRQQHEAASTATAADTIAIAERMFNTLAHHRFLLEYDDERSGSFEPLRFLPKGKDVVLGG